MKPIIEGGIIVAKFCDNNRYAYHISQPCMAVLSSSKRSSALETYTLGNNSTMRNVLFTTIDNE